VISLGYNGSLSKVSDEDAVLQDLATVHAEENAVILASGSLQDSTLYVTHAPCNGCGRMVFDAGITIVNYLTRLGCPHFFDNVTKEFSYTQNESSLLTELLTTIRQYFEAQHILPGDTIVPQTAIHRIQTALCDDSPDEISLASYQLLKEPKVMAIHPTIKLESGVVIDKLVAAFNFNDFAEHIFVDMTKDIKLSSCKWNNTHLILGTLKETQLLLKEAYPLTNLRCFVAMR
jgi:hypothetical protein